MDIETLATRYSGIPSHWKLSTLGESLTAIIGGGTPSRDNPSLWGGPIPWLTVKDMRGRRPSQAQEYITEKAVKESATNIIPPDTVITATRVGLGKVVRVPFAAAINQDLKALVVGPDLDKSYLEYWLVSIASFLEAIGSGTTVKGIRLETLRQLPIPLAPLEEQREIVAEIETQFSRLDEAVANLQRVKANLKRYKATVLQSAIEGKLIESAVNFSDVPLQRLIGRIAQGWSPKCDLNREALPDEWAVITTTAVQPMQYLDNQGKPLPADLIPRPGIEIKKGDFLMTRKGPRKRAGVACLVRSTRHRLMVCDTVYRFRCDESVVKAEYLELALNAPKVVDAIDHLKAGISESGVSLTHNKLGGVLIPLPPLEHQAKIVAEVDRHLSIIREVEAEIDTNLQRAKALRQATLAKAFSVN
jgi:type I restriction enzyme S subunit